MIPFGARLRLAPLTAGIAIFCVGLFVAGLARPELFEQGVLLPDAVWGGQWWRLFTAVFLHVGFAHVAFNILWFWQLGFAIEVRSGSFVLMLLTLASGVAGSLAELAFAALDYPGSVGLSGAVYGLFLFGFVALRPLGGPFEQLFSRKNAQVFLGWGLLCILFTVMDFLPVANFAHAAGALLGALLGLLFAPRTRWRLPGGALAMLVLAGLGLAGLRPFWTSRYQAFQAIEAFEARQWTTASRLFSKVAAREPEAYWIQANLAISLWQEGRMAEAVAAARKLPDSYISGLKTPNAEIFSLLRPGALMDPAAAQSDPPAGDGSGIGSLP